MKGQGQRKKRSKETEELEPNLCFWDGAAKEGDFLHTLYQLKHKGSPRILEWLAYPFSSRSSQPRNRTRVSCMPAGFFTSWVIREAHHMPIKRKACTLGNAPQLTRTAGSFGASDVSAATTVLFLYMAFSHVFVFSFVLLCCYLIFNYI